MAFDTPFLIIETGQPAGRMKRHKGFPHWIRVAAGLEPDEAVSFNVEQGEILPDHAEGFAGVLVTGSAAMVTDRHDWSERTADWLRQAAHAGVPMLGICYGHQLIAHALGGEVGWLPQREMGTVGLQTDADHTADDALFQGLPATFNAQATHLQTVVAPPEGAVVLARSELDDCHAFRWQQHVWGLQFHPEFSRTTMQGYVRARREELQAEGIDHRELHDKVSATPHARQVLRRFVRHARAARHR
ncbi:glutamine amidotransferase [Luteimonas sp. FXH3W]|uniref:Glutamine amidotransferase n=1 Tax=Aquilutibacter rugosus TaxID=3115820 RepID=A0ABU7UXA6_9GAMM